MHKLLLVTTFAAFLPKYLCLVDVFVNGSMYCTYVVACGAACGSIINFYKQKIANICMQNCLVQCNICMTVFLFDI